MKISIVVPAYNEEKLLAASLESMQGAAKALRERGWEVELIVCDNNSTDRTAEIARAAGAKVVFEPVNQISRARNAGAAAATGDWLVFVDADSQPSHGLFQDMAETMAGGRCIAGGSTVVMNELPRQYGGWLLWLWNWLSRTARWMAGSFIFCEARAFRQLGGFSLELFISEEIDFSRRLKKLARQTGREIVILRRHPLATSARKLHLYAFRDYLRLLWTAFWRGDAAFKQRENCRIWYDGRR